MPSRAFSDDLNRRDRDFLHQLTPMMRSDGVTLGAASEDCQNLFTGLPNDNFANGSRVSSRS
ncbi:hypothetical protein ABIA45_007959 [Bradyrhizobium sp. USDA 336]